MKCPICGMMMELKQKDYHLTTQYGNTKGKISLFICPECGYDIDDKNTNKKTIAKLKNEIYSNYIFNILNSIKKDGKNFTELERKFNLPSKTLSKWMNKSNNPSASAVALLQLIKAFPWLEVAAEYNFDSKKSQEIILNYYLSQINDEYKKISYTYCEPSKQSVFVAVINHKDEKKDNSIEYENFPTKRLTYSFGGTTYVD